MFSVTCHFAPCGTVAVSSFAASVWLSAPFVTVATIGAGSIVRLLFSIAIVRVNVTVPAVPVP